LRKFVFELTIYLVISIGALIMLMPFLWMLDTSFKLPSEVLTWPPRWITKNFFNNRELKVFIDLSRREGINFEGLTLSELMNLSLIESAKEEKNSLKLKIFDDPPRRGKLFITIFSKDGSTARYAKNITEEEKEKLLNILINNRPVPKDIDSKIDKILESSESSVDLIGNLFEDLFYSEDSIFNRKNFVEEFEKSLEGVLNKIDRYEEGVLNHRILRISDSDSMELKNEKELLKKILNNYITTKRKTLILLKNELYDYKRGLQSILKLNEAKEILQRILKIPETKLSIEGITFNYLKPESLLSFISRNFDLPIEKWKNLLLLFIDFSSFFDFIQKDQLDSSTIIVAYRDRSKVVKNFIDEVKNLDLPEDVSEEVIRFFKEDPTKFLSRFIGWMDSMTMNEVKGTIESDYLRDLINKINEITSIFKDLNLEYKEKEKFLESLFSNISNGEEIPEEIKDRMIKLVGENQYRLTVIGLSNLLKVVHKNNHNKIWKAMISRLKFTEYLKSLSSIYNDVTTRMEIIEAPEAVVSVRKESGDILRITFSGIRGFWFEDDLFKVKAKFSFTEAFLNLFQNYIDAWKAAPFSRYYFNTIFVATTTTILEIIFASMAAFAFAKLNFFGKNFVFLLFLSTMMIPGEVLLVPNYITLSKFGWLDTYYALIIPWIVSVFAIFLIRQHFLALPNELYDAAKIDGCSDWKFLWEVMVPLSKPVIITSALLKFVGSWNSFLWVLIVTKSPEIRTLPVGLQNFSSEVGTLYNQLMAASTFSILPVIGIFLFAQKQFIKGIARTGLK